MLVTIYPTNPQIFFSIQLYTKIDFVLVYHWNNLFWSSISTFTWHVPCLISISTFTVDNFNLHHHLLTVRYDQEIVDNGDNTYMNGHSNPCDFITLILQMLSTTYPFINLSFQHANISGLFRIHKRFILRVLIMFICVRYIIRKLQAMYFQSIITYYIILCGVIMKATKHNSCIKHTYT